MCCSLAWSALMRRNLIYRRRKLWDTVLDMALPVFFLCILLLIKNSLGTDDLAAETVPPFIPTESSTNIPLTFQDFVTAMRAERKCVPDSIDFPEDSPLAAFNSEFRISGIPSGGVNWMVPTVKCDARMCEEPGQDARKFCEYSILGLAGTDEGGNSRVDDFQRFIRGKYPVLDPAYNGSDGLQFDFDFVKIFPSPSSIDDYVKDGRYGDGDFPKLAMAVVFEGNSTERYAYSLRQNATNFNSPQEEARPGAFTTPDTGVQLESFAKTDSCPSLGDGGEPFQGRLDNTCTGKYMYNGLIPFQRLVNDFILFDSGAEEAGFFVSEAGVQFTQFPARAYEDSGFFGDIADVTPLLLILGFLWPLASIVGAICKEKELRQKELMKMMGVSELEINGAWFMSYFSYHFFTAVFCTLVSGALYENSELSVLFIFWMLTLLSFIMFGMFCATLTSKATRGILIGLLLFFCGVFVTLSVDYQTANSGTLAGASLHPVVAFGFGIQEIGYLEDRGVGLQRSTIDQSDYASGYTFSNAIGSLILDIVIFGFLTFYLNRVIEPDYGQAKPWHFPVSSLLKLCGLLKVKASDTSDMAPVEESVPNEPVGDALLSQASEGKSIEIRGLRKTFGKKHAVDGLTMSMYNGQITALLGHNGAGKTTTIGMLTGALAPTEGTAIVAGKDIRSEMNAIRGSVGICLQHDCLFPELTVREHIQFFSRVKGLYKSMGKEDAEAQIDQVIQDVALSEKSSTFSRNLSGGMKRKLSVAIAFCGGSKTILLDEPTSGMDPFSRRFTWNVIRQYRQDRCIILTTHFMDEADILGDRIAIMSEGQLRCCGSSLFLKKTYGVGYQLTLEKNTGAQSTSVDGKDSDLEQIVSGSVEGSSLLSNVAGEMSFQLPMGAAAQFPPMFEGLDKKVDQGVLASYGVSITTLDEVFLLVARGESNEKTEHLASAKQVDSSQNVDDAGKSARSHMNIDQNVPLSTHLSALFKKRAANFRRDKKAWVCTTIIPSFFVLLGLILFTFGQNGENLDPVTLNLSTFNADFNGAPKNPIVFNNPVSGYVCQPGICAPGLDQVVNPISNELYYACGAQAKIPGDPSCSVSESSDVMTTLDGFQGASAEGVDVANASQASEALFESAGVYAASMYGAVFFNHEEGSLMEDGSSYGDTAVSQCVDNAVDANYTDSLECERFRGVGYSIHYNFTALHASPLYQSLADQALARHALGSDSFLIETTIAPLPLTSLEEEFGEAANGFSVFFLVVLSFPFISGAFATFIVTERQSKAKHLQTVAGVKPSAYWISTFLWDMMNYQFPMWIMVILMFAFDVELLTTTDRGVRSGVITALFFYGPASAGFTYCVSFLFSSPSLCNIFVILSGFLIGLGGPLTNFIMTIIAYSDTLEPDQGLLDAADIVTWILRFFPTFNLGKALLNCINIQFYDLIEGKKVQAWSEPILLIEVIFLVVQSFVYLLLAILIDRWSTNPRAVSIWKKFVRTITCRCGGRKKDSSDVSMAIPDDDDVVNEQERVLAGEANDDLILLSGLTKQYDDGKLAVNNLSFGIPPGQCFGLLGINGAGKTTTMGMLTAEFPPSSGDASLAGFSVTKQPEKTRRLVGYCPQFDAHFDNMTGREHVELYASIKGIPRQFVKEAAADKLAEVGLSETDCDRLAAAYSGGMKRRLSLACATIGQPRVVFLDEASTGVDPVARREIWELISKMVTRGSNDEERTSVVLTTHSMEECEALCPRIAIMANSRLRCLGSAQHLKNKFGRGFQVEMKVQVLDIGDSDYIANYAAVAGTGEEEASDPEKGVTSTENDKLLNLVETKAMLVQLGQDDPFLADLLNAENPPAYTLWRNANNSAATVAEVAAFATNELRMRRLDNFVQTNYPGSVLRERQDSKARYEISSQNVRISHIFASIEREKEDLRLADYGVSQTSLEQVFNMHAAEAERLKHGGTAEVHTPNASIAEASAPKAEVEDEYVIAEPSAPKAEEDHDATPDSPAEEGDPYQVSQ